MSFSFKSYLSLYQAQFLDVRLNDMAEAVSGFTEDSRRIAPGDVFFATTGHGFDGQEYVSDAFDRGASYAVVPQTFQCSDAKIDRLLIRALDVNCAHGLAAQFYYEFPDKEIRVIGVTGTNGKTSVSHMIAHLLVQQGESVGILGTLGAYYQGRHVSKLPNTSPNAALFYRWLRRFVTMGARWVICEVSSHALALKRFSGCHFESVAFLNLTHEHLDFHTTMDEYFDAKSALFKHPFNHAWVNADCEWGQKLASQLKNKKQDVGSVTSGQSNLNDRCISISESSTWHKNHMQLRGCQNKRKLEIRASLAAGLFPPNVGLALGVLSDVHALPSEVDLSTFKVPGRLELYRVRHGGWVLIDYAHTPIALEMLLTRVRQILSVSKVTLVFGCGGDRDRSKRPLMGAVAAEYSDETVLTCDNPRSERMQEIVADIQSGMKHTARVVLNRATAIRKVLDRTKKKDLVVIVGKGHENVQQMGNDQTPFSDELVCRPYLLPKV